MKKVFISIFTLIFIISMVNYVFAATSGSVEVRSSSTTIKAGDEITIFVSAADSNTIYRCPDCGRTFRGKPSSCPCGAQFA